MKIQQEQIIQKKQEQVEEKPDIPTPEQIRHLQQQVEGWQEERAEYTYNDGKMIRRLGSIIGEDRHRTKDCLEYMNNSSNLKIGLGLKYYIDVDE